MSEVEAHDVRLVTDIAAPTDRYAALKAIADGIPLLVPDVLRLAPHRD